MSTVVTDELDVLLTELGRRGYLLYSFRTDLHGPEVLAAVYDWGGVADVVILHAENHALAFRTPTGPGVDVFAPMRVVWSYVSSSVWTLRALLTLPAPDRADAPREPVDAPPGLGLPEAGRLPARITMRRPR